MVNLVIEICAICDAELKSFASLSKHIRDQHADTDLQNYYLTNIGSDICKACNSKMKWLSFATGFKCSRSCGAKLYRQRLRSDDKKYAQFIERASIVRKEIWSNRSDENRIEISRSISSTLKEYSVSLTEEQRKEKFGWLNQLSNEEKYVKVNEILDKSLRKFWATASEEEKQHVYDKRQATKETREYPKHGLTMAKYNQGMFNPNNPKKYVGNISQIIWRSGYELTFMMWCDRNPNVLEWASEEVVIPYHNMLDEERERVLGRRIMHRYYVDFYIKVKNLDGTTDKYLIEVKPYHQTIPPKPNPKQTMKTIQMEHTRWITNVAKWTAAREFCAKRGLKFKIITEIELYGKKP